MNQAGLLAGPGAFGDGRHPTTAMVLAALEALDPADFTPRIACDMGAGSGILSLAMAVRFGCPVVAVDISADSVATMQGNAKKAGLAVVSAAEGAPSLRQPCLLPVHADGFAHPYSAATAPYDLMVMNILAEPLLSLAADAAAHLAPNGVLILSGLLQWQEATIREAYAALGLELASRLTSGDWVCLCWRKEG